LVVEGVLVEEGASGSTLGREEVVFIVYDRLADHMIAKMLLDTHLDVNDPPSAFAMGGPLAFLADNEQYVPSGLLEAMCIQVPERLGKELVELLPAIEECWGIGDAFRQSLIWRALTAFSDSTRDVLNRLSKEHHGVHKTLEVLLTVATLSGHPLNALFLDKRLRKDTMPERDARWSIYLHQAWGHHGTVDRLVDWAYAVKPAAAIDEEALDLCAIVLAWMFTTSNRFLRDQATNALVNLLTGRIPAVTRLVERFANVDDPYVLERVYAVAYGTSMRSHNSIEVGKLAGQVYSDAFAAGSPLPHILLRDYARGVVERALYLGARIEVDVSRIRPPYKSQWPGIPTEEEIKPLLPDWSRGSHDSGDVEWARNRIGFSVMSDDFARYVIGTNASPNSRHWLSLKLEEEPWRQPEHPEDQLRTLVETFSDAELEAWSTFEAADQALNEAKGPLEIKVILRGSNEEDGSIELPTISGLKQGVAKADSSEIDALKAKREDAINELDSVLTDEHAQRLGEILASEQTYYRNRRPPGFELSQIQRYILWRVFDLGWTTERFGRFDRFSIGYHGRGASKAERIGKKYQWIAYHEILALLADHFQYWDSLEENRVTFDGPWQEGRRDIDPSSTIRSTRDSSSWERHTLSWWAPVSYDSWENPADPREWALHCDDLPDITELLSITNPEDGSRWINTQVDFNWQTPQPVDRDSSDVERREIWLMCTGYLVRTEDAQAFITWSEGVDLYGRWMPDPPTVYRMFLGEHGWSSASQYFQREYFGYPGWVEPREDCAVKVYTTAFEYLREVSSFDCGIDESYKLYLPAVELMAGMGLQWSGKGAEFTDARGQLAAFDPTAYEEGPSALLLREESLREFLVREGLTICWAVVGEKRALPPGLGSRSYPMLRLSAAYMLGEDGLTGFLKCMVDDPEDGDLSADPEVLKVIRSSA
jgi:hypothetical protein